MRKWLLISLAVWVSLGVASALADVTITATITKDKDKEVFEELIKVKFVDLLVVVNVEPVKFAESEAIVNQENTFNEACENCAEKRDQIVDSGTGNSGVLTINQAAGNMNNQGSAISIAVDVVVDPEDPENTGFAEAQAAADQLNSDNIVESVDILFREASISNSLNTNSGVVHVNQSAGNMNNQANALSIAVSFDVGVALAESDLGQLNTLNLVQERNVGFGFDESQPKTASITGSVNGNTGVIGVNQSAGNMANQANVVSIAAAVTSLPTPPTPATP